MGHNNNTLCIIVYVCIPNSHAADSVTIVLSCPAPSPASLRSCLGLYSLVMSGLGTAAAGLWVVGHIHVLLHTVELGLKLQRSIVVSISYYIVREGDRGKWQNFSIEIFHL